MATTFDRLATAAQDPASSLFSKYVRKAQIAEALGVSQRTIDRWVERRLLPAPIKLGRTALYHLPTVEKHLAEQARRNGRKPARRPYR